MTWPWSMTAGIAGTIANAGGLHVQMQSRFMRLYPEMVPAFEETLPFYPRAVRHWQALAAAPRRATSSWPSPAG